MDDIIKFLRKKDYKYIDYIGQGGTGKTILIEDESINERFVCKKYSPIYEEHQTVYYNNFVSEIKLLHLLYHKNVVRFFNHYLYPELVTGYILMEFIDGHSISEFLKENPERIDEVFIQTITGFEHLEENNILHRDIRPSNILVSSGNLVKIIDFGFGKKIDFSEDQINSVSLNWYYPKPRDFSINIYDHRTEIYFVGKLFEEIIVENDIQNFGYPTILKSMVLHDYESRINSFFDVSRKIIEGEPIETYFSKDEKIIYQDFARGLQSIITKIEDGAEYFKDIDSIIKNLEDIYRNSMLEDYIQNQLALSRCFIRGEYYFTSKPDLISVPVLRAFLQLIKHSSVDKKRVVINNLWQRLDNIKRYVRHVDDDLPF